MNRLIAALAVVLVALIVVSVVRASAGDVSLEIDRALKRLPVREAKVIQAPDGGKFACTLLYRGNGQAIKKFYMRCVRIQVKAAS